VAASLDPWPHGQRGTEPAEQLAPRVVGNLRRHAWPTLGQATLDALGSPTGPRPPSAAAPGWSPGGVSVGGDVAVALAGVDQRVSRVGAVVATPGWTRPGVGDLVDPSRVLPQGQADADAPWSSDRLDPLSRRRADARGPAVTLGCGADDAHVPPGGALRFRAALRAAYAAVAERVRVTVHPGVGHLEGARHPAPARDCLAWFLESPAPAA
jgi:uncharacterized protein